jgi:hypothetical protein
MATQRWIRGKRVPGVRQAAPAGTGRLRAIRAATALLALSFGAGCGGSSLEADPAIAPFVGTWDAVVFLVTSEANPSTVVDVLAIAPFFIHIEPSGQYTATLQYTGVTPEVGQLTVIGSTIRLDPAIPADAPTVTASYVFVREDYLVLDGPTQFDFNLDGTSEPARAHIELQRRS